jgi:hypothetical protein
MAIDHAPAATRRRRRARTAPIQRGYLALTAALYPDGHAVSAEILELDLASCGEDADDAYAMIIEAVEGALEAAHHDHTTGLETFIREAQLTVYPEPPPTYRPAAIPSHLLMQPGLILRPVSISIEAVLRG